MQGNKLLGSIFLILGILAMSYGGFTYTRDKEKARVGPVRIEVEDKKRVNIPLWVGVACAVGGARPSITWSSYLPRWPGGFSASNAQHRTRFVSG